MAALKTKTEPEAEDEDIDFVSKVDESFCCGICLSVAMEPRQHGKCGKLFCKQCLTKYQTMKKDCPYCRQNRAEFFEDNRSKCISY